MKTPQATFDPVRPNLKHKTNVLKLEKVPTGPCEMEFRPPSQHWNSNGESVIPVLAWASLAGLIASVLLRWPQAANLLLIGTVIVGGFALSIGVPGLVTWACFAATKVRDSVQTRGRWNVIRSMLLVPLGFWMVAMLGCTTRSEAAALMFLLVLGWPAMVYAADRMATHSLYYLSAQPRLDRATQVKWRTDWGYRDDGFSSPQPRRNDLTPEERAEFDRLCQHRLQYRSGRWWLLGLWTAPVLFGWLFVGDHEIARRLVIAVGLLASMSVWVSEQKRQYPGSWSVFRLALASWIYFEHGPEMPPWVFNTPVGTQAERQSEARRTVALLSIGLVPLAGGIGSQFGSPATLGELTSRTIGIVATFVIPIAVFVQALYCLTAPVLSCWYQLLDIGGTKLEHLPGETAFDGYVRRIQESQNAQEKNCLFVGFNEAHEYPVLLDSDLLFEHMHMLGATGIGKTALGLATLVIQLIRRGDGPVVVTDCKGDPAFFNTVRRETEKAGRKFKWFTNLPNRSTYVFNPFQQSYLDGLTLLQVVGLFIQSLNLHHGDDYGRAWFSANSRALLKIAFEATLATLSRDGRRRLTARMPRITSFRDLHEIIELIAKDGEDIEAAKHLCLIIEMLSEFEQLNMSPKQDPRHPAVVNAIHMPEVIREKQVIYFYLVGAIDQTSVAEIGRLGLYSLLTAAMAHQEQTGKAPRCYFIADEAQMLIAQNIANVLAQARSYGVACILSHQSMSQLSPPGGVDLTELVQNCTSVKQYFSAREPRTMQYISDVSGQVAYYNQSWQQSLQDVADEQIRVTRATAASVEELPVVGISEIVGPRMQAQDIQDVNFDPNLSVLTIERGQGLTQFQGAFAMRTNFPIEKAEFEHRRDDIPWPTSITDTITVNTAWPAANAVTVTPKNHPGNVDELLKNVLDGAKLN